MKVIKMQKLNIALASLIIAGASYVYADCPAKISSHRGTIWAAKGSDNILWIDSKPINAYDLAPDTITAYINDNPPQFSGVTAKVGSANKIEEPLKIRSNHITCEYAWGNHVINLTASPDVLLTQIPTLTNWTVTNMPLEFGWDKIYAFINCRSSNPSDCAFELIPGENAAKSTKRKADDEAVNEAKK